MIDLQFLKKVGLLKGLNDKQIHFFSRFLTIKDISSNENIITENTSGNSLYILYRGSVKITKQLTIKELSSFYEEKQLVSLTAEHHPAFGENGLVGAGKRTANVIATSDCTVYRLTKEKFDNFVDKDLEAGYIIMKNIAQNLAKHLKKTDENVVKLATALSLTVSKSF